jgi:hypothetical protein
MLSDTLELAGVVIGATALGYLTVRGCQEAEKAITGYYCGNDNQNVEEEPAPADAPATA